MPKFLITYSPTRPIKNAGRRGGGGSRRRRMKKVVAENLVYIAGGLTSGNRIMFGCGVRPVMYPYV